MAVTLTARLWPGAGGGAVLNRLWLGCPKATRQGTGKHYIITSEPPICMLCLQSQDCYNIGGR